MISETLAQRWPDGLTDVGLLALNSGCADVGFEAALSANHARRYICRINVGPTTHCLSG